MIFELPDRGLTPSRLEDAVDSLRREVSGRRWWRYCEKYVDRGTIRDPFYILDMAPDGEEPGDALLDEPLFATGVSSLMVKHLTRRLDDGKDGYWQRVESGALLVRLDRFLEMYRANRLEPPGLAEGGHGGARHHQGFDNKRFVYRLKSPAAVVVGVGPAMHAGALVPAGAVIGRVMIDDAPASGVTVILEPTPAQRPDESSERTTQADGSFYFTQVTPRRYRLRVPGHGASLDVVVEPFGYVRGRATRRDGAPLRGARVVLEAPDGARFESTTTRAGALDLGPVPALPYDFYVPGLRSSLQVAVEDDGLIGGTLRDGEGIVLSGVGLTLLTSDGSKIAEARTDEHGYFRLGPLRGGSYLLESRGHRLAWHPAAGGVLEGKIHGPGRLDLQLVAGEALVSKIAGTEGGHFRSEGLVPGSYFLAAEGYRLEVRSRR